MTSYQDEGKSARKSYRTRPECMRLLRNTLYIGHYERRGRVNPNFCQPIIPHELSVNVKAASSGRVYLFTSIMVCDECAHKLTVAISKGYV